MEEVKDLIDRLSQSGSSIFWQGAASDSSIDALELKLGRKLPKSLRQFLSQCGGGGVEGSEISGIESDSPGLDYKGTIFGDTKECREFWGLPENLVVIYFKDEEICWCLEILDNKENVEPAIVSYSLSLRRRDRLIADSFLEFLNYYVTMHSVC